MSFENGILEASGLDFGGLGPPFWRVRASFSKALDVIFGTTNAKNAQKPAKTKAPSQGGQTAKWWVGGGDPPGGFQLNPPHPAKDGWRMGLFCGAVPGGFWLCQGPCAFRRPILKVLLSNGPGHFFRFCGLPKNALNFVSKK